MIKKLYAQNEFIFLQLHPVNKTHKIIFTQVTNAFCSQRNTWVFHSALAVKSGCSSSEQFVGNQIYRVSICFCSYSTNERAKGKTSAPKGHSWWQFPAGKSLCPLPSHLPNSSGVSLIWNLVGRRVGISPSLDNNLMFGHLGAFPCFPRGCTALTSADRFQTSFHFSPLPFVAKFKHYAERPLKFNENQQSFVPNPNPINCT